MQESGSLQESNTIEIEIEPSLWADHSYIRFTWKGRLKTPRWTLQRMILKEEEFKIKLEKEMKFFFEENREEGTSLQNTWDTAKAVMRGIAINYMANKNKKRYSEKHQKWNIEG
uniref:Uncharacterized protein n=1 Tax=Micrurus paraensis TaxID=1970185 RepID=A0A2D4L6Q7_9SAUR